MSDQRAQILAFKKVNKPTWFDFLTMIIFSVYRHSNIILDNMNYNIKEIQKQSSTVDQNDL